VVLTPSPGAVDGTAIYIPINKWVRVYVSDILRRLFTNKSFTAHVHFHTCDVMTGLDTIIGHLNAGAAGPMGKQEREFSISGCLQQITSMERTDAAGGVTTLLSSDDRWVAAGLTRRLAAKLIPGRVEFAKIKWAQREKDKKWVFSIVERRVAGGQPGRKRNREEPEEVEGP
jgi:hypothetical protein